MIGYKWYLISPKNAGDDMSNEEATIERLKRRLAKLYDLLAGAKSDFDLRKSIRGTIETVEAYIKQQREKLEKPPLSPS